MAMHPIERIMETVHLFGDKRVPFTYKLLPIAAVAYLVWPFDLSSDFVPFLGQIDDAAIFAGLLGLFVSLSRKKIT